MIRCTCDARDNPILKGQHSPRCPLSADGTSLDEEAERLMHRSRERRTVEEPARCERERIVAWLRERAQGEDYGDGREADSLRSAADAIERCHHHRNTP